MGIKIIKQEVEASFYDKVYYKDGKFDLQKTVIAEKDRLNELSDILNRVNSKILDIGSGLGKLDRLIESNFPHIKVYSIDISKALLQILPKENLSKHAVGNAYNVPFKNESFELVLLSDILEHVEKPQRLIEEANRVLKNNGYLYISVPNKYSLAFLKGKNYFLSDPTHTFIPSKSNIKELLSNNFNIIYHKTIFDFLKKKQLRGLFNGPIHLPYLGLYQRVIAVKK